MNSLIININTDSRRYIREQPEVMTLTVIIYLNNDQNLKNRETWDRSFETRETSKNAGISGRVSNGKQAM